MDICLVTRALGPTRGGGIGAYVANLARLLADDGTVTVITTRERHPLVDRRVRLRLVDEPASPALEHYMDVHQAWGATVLAELEACYGERGPDLLELPDHHAEGFVPIQAKRTGHPTLRETAIAVRAHGSWELRTLLNGHLPDTVEARSVCDMERYALRHADAFLWAGGDVLQTYLRYYGAGAIAPAHRVRHPLEPGAGAVPRTSTPGSPLRFLHFGRLERRKGLIELVSGFMRNPSDAWTLTLVGADTPSAPLGTSMRAELELLAAGDERVRILDPQPPERLAATIADHDVVVMPSPWACWPYAALESLRANRPILATPVGGHVELVEDSVTGWLTRGTAPADLARGLDMLLDEPELVDRAIGSGACVARCAMLADAEAIRASYRGLVAAHARRPHARPRRRSTPLVSAIVPYKRTPRHLLETVDSLLGQTHRRLELVIVDDGSFDPSDAVLGEAAERPRVRIVHQSNGGLGAARNAGIVHSRGRYVFPLDADNVAEPTFVARAVELLEADPGLAYVTCWSRYIDESGAEPYADTPVGYHPLGNFSGLVEELNVAGDAAAVWPRRLWDVGFGYSEDVPIVEDWMLWRQMARAGHIGEVIPERLIRYRVRADSMYRLLNDERRARLRAEMSTRLAIMETQWTPSSA